MWEGAVIRRLLNNAVLNKASRNNSTRWFSSVLFRSHGKCFANTAGMHTSFPLYQVKESRCRQNYQKESEDAVNKQINLEMFASYTYTSIAFYVDRDDVSFPKLHEYFKKLALEEYEHAKDLMKYQNFRGGQIKLEPIAQPAKDTWGSLVEILKSALDLEKLLTENLLKVHAIASKNNDPHLSDYIESKQLTDQVESIKKLSDFITQAQRCGPGLGEFMYDKEFES